MSITGLMEGKSAGGEDMLARHMTVDLNVDMGANGACWLGMLGIEMRILSYHRKYRAHDTEFPSMLGIRPLYSAVHEPSSRRIP